MVRVPGTTHSVGQALLDGGCQHYGRGDEYEHQEGHVEQARGHRALDLVSEAAQSAGGRPRTAAEQVQATHLSRARRRTVLESFRIRGAEYLCLPQYGVSHDMST